MNKGKKTKPRNQERHHQYIKIIPTKWFSLMTRRHRNFHIRAITQNDQQAD